MGNWFGISLFIAAGVAQSTFVGTLSPLPAAGGGMGDFSVQNPPSERYQWFSICLEHYLILIWSHKMDLRSCFLLTLIP